MCEENIISINSTFNAAEIKAGQALYFHGDKETPEFAKL